MSRDWQLVSTTHLDTQGEIVTEEALTSIYINSKDDIIPIIMNHDPRHPPVGRVINLEIVDLEDGHKGLNAEIDYFDGPDALSTIVNKEVKLPYQEPGTIILSTDITFRDDESKQILAELSKLSDIKVGYMAKKASEPLSYLTISFAFIAGMAANAFLKGYFTKAGEDAWKKTKEYFKKLSKHPKGEERFIVIECNLCSESESTEMQLRIIVNKPFEEIEKFLEEDIQKVDKIIAGVLKDKDKIAYVVYIYENGLFSFSHAISRQGLAMLPPGKTIEFPDLSSKNFSLQGNGKLREAANDHLDDPIIKKNSE